MYSDLVIVANTFATGDHLTSRWSVYSVFNFKYCGELEQYSPPVISHPRLLFSCNDLIEPYSACRHSVCTEGAASVYPNIMGLKTDI